MGASYLGGTQEERRRAFDTLREVYNMRSEAVHSGHVEEKRKNLGDAKAVLQEGAELTRKMAYKIMSRGEYPDWDTHVFNVV
jgi:hypothetical protein